MKKKVAWFSTGVSSAVAIYLKKEEIDEILYIHIGDQHEDSLRFLHDFEKVLGKEITILQSRYENVDQVQQQFRYINGPYGAKCTEILKKRVRKEWEQENKEHDITYIWGFDLDEKHRADRIVETMTDYKHEFPLIERNMTKEDSHGVMSYLGIKRPVMYDMGYSNNNCIGCPKGGMGYWNKIRVDFPEVFALRAKRERQIGASCLKDKNGKVYLDELDPTRGRMEDEIITECNIFCQLNMNEVTK